MILVKPVFENVRSKDGGSFACLEFQGPEFECPYHFHPELEITWILSSEGQRMAGDSWSNFAAGDLDFFGSGLPHLYRNWNPGNAHSRYIQFREDVFGRDLWGMPECSRIRRLMAEAGRGLCFRGKAARESQALMEKIYSARPGVLRIGLLLELLDRMARAGASRPLASEGYRAEPVKERTGKKMHELLHYVEDHWTEPMRLEDVAHRVKMHPRSLSRFFRRQMGTTFQDYVVEVRLGRAARRLIEDEGRVSEIAYASGFNNLSNFNRLFARRYRCCPRDYRRRLLGEQTRR
jgi:AraC-like DNA-binding protein